MPDDALLYSDNRQLLLPINKIVIEVRYVFLYSRIKTLF